MEIPPTPSEHTHSWAKVWTSDRDFHWHECEAEGCTVTEDSGKQGYAAHQEDNGTVAQEPDEDTPGRKLYSCTVCQRVLRTEEIPALGFEISGTVTEDQDPVAGANVKLMRGIDEVQETTTDSAGRYGFSGVRPGIYNVVATKDGKTMTILVIITMANATEQNLTMPGENVN